MADSEKTPNREVRASDSALKVGEPAPRDVYTDDDGHVVNKEPERGALLVAKGDIVTQAMADQAKGK